MSAEECQGVHTLFDSYCNYSLVDDDDGDDDDGGDDDDDDDEVTYNVHQYRDDKINSEI